MTVALTINGISYDYPETGDLQWGPDATNWASAVTSGMLQKAGGTFTLLADVDFGANYGLKSLYYKTRTSNIATAGQFRLARADVISWRNEANGGNLDLSVNSSDALLFNGVALGNFVSVSDTSTIDLTLSAGNLTADIVAGSITNTMINASAAIAFSKLATLSSGNILVGSAGNVATSVAMSGDATIVASGAVTIANSAVSNAKMANMNNLTIKGNDSGGAAAPQDLTATEVTAILNEFVGDSGAGGLKGLVTAPIAGDASKFLKGDGTWATPPGAGDVVGPASSTNNGFAKFDGTTGKLLKDSAATISNSDVNASAAIALSKLAALSASRALVSDGSGVIAASSVTTTTLGYLDATSSVQTQLNSKADGAASSTDEAFARFDSTTGKVLQNSVVTCTDAGVIAGITQLNTDNLRLDGNTVSSTDANGNVIIEPNGTGKTQLTANKGLLLSDDDSSAGVTVKVPSALSGDWTFTLPSGAGLDGQLLKSNGSGTASWAYAFNKAGVVTAESASYTVTDTDGVSVVDMTTGGTARTVTLPTAADNIGRIITVKKVDSGSGTVTVDGEGAEPVGDTATKILCNIEESITVVCNGTGWDIISQYFGIVNVEAWTDGFTNATTSVNVSRVGQKVIVSGVMSMTGAVTGSPTITVPAKYTIKTASYDNNIIGTCGPYDSSVTTLYNGIALITDANTITFYVINTSSTYSGISSITNTVPFTWAASDTLGFSLEWIVDGW